MFITLSHVALGAVLRELVLAPVTLALAVCANGATMTKGALG